MRRALSGTVAVSSGGCALTERVARVARAQSVRGLAYRAAATRSARPGETETAAAGWSRTRRPVAGQRWIESVGVLGSQITHGRSIRIGGGQERDQLPGVGVQLSCARISRVNSASLGEESVSRARAPPSNSFDDLRERGTRCVGSAVRAIGARLGEPHHGGAPRQGTCRRTDRNFLWWVSLPATRVASRQRHAVDATPCGDFRLDASRIS